VVDDAQVVQSEMNYRQDLDRMLVRDSSTSTTQSIESFLNKPFLLGSGIFQPSDTVSTFTRFIVPDEMVNATMFKNKLDGYLGFRATMVFRLMVNANTFQQGRYMLAFVYGGGDDPNSAQGLEWYNMHINSLTQRTQLPRVEIDLCCDTEAIIRIPFISKFNFYPLAANTVAGFGDVGTLTLFPYVPVSSAAATTCSYTIWSYFEDVELVTAAAPQSSRPKLGKSLTQREQASQGVGPISSVAVKVSALGSRFARVPMLSAYGNTLSWVADLVGDSAKIFGWCKPVTAAAALRTLPQIMPYMANVDTVDNSNVMSFTVGQEVSKLPGFAGTDADELSFRFLATIPAYFANISWPTSATGGTFLAEYGVHPHWYQLNKTLNGKVYTDFTPVAFLARHFNQWRGGITYNCKIVKTGFHSGRIMVAYHPHVDGLAIPARTYGTAMYVLKEIIDVRETSDFSVTVPYSAISPFLNTSTVGPQTNGTISFIVVDPLIAPPTVSSTINILVEVCGAEDIEFAVPRANALCPVINIAPQSSNPLKGDTCLILNGVIGGSKISSSLTASAESCVGERIDNFRTLLKLPSPLLPTTAGPMVAMGPVSLINPFAWIVYKNAATPLLPLTTPDLFSRLCSCYAMTRGGVRIKMVVSAPSSLYFPIQVQAAYAGATGSRFLISGAGDVTIAEYGKCGAPSCVVSNTNASAEVQVPGYTITHSRSNVRGYEDPTSGAVFSAAAYDNPTRISFSYRNSIGGTFNPTFFRSGADDLNFGCFVSIPTMYDILSTELYVPVRT
jgi:hypothetical protein